MRRPLRSTADRHAERIFALEHEEQVGGHNAGYICRRCWDEEDEHSIGHPNGHPHDRIGCSWCLEERRAAMAPSEYSDADPPTPLLFTAVVSAVFVWLVLTVLLIVGNIALTSYRHHHHVSDAELRRVCKTYAELDLSQATGVCIKVGYHQR